MKLCVLTNTAIQDSWLDELRTYVDWEIEVRTTAKKLPAKYNPYFNTFWGDFDWLRQQVGDADIRCFCTTSTKLKEAGITGHIGMYDAADSDSKLDMYIGLPEKKDKRATLNGFTHNFAWLIIHEYLHGEEQQSGSPDRVHDMEANGRLTELFSLHKNRRSKLFTFKDLLTKLLDLFTRIGKQ